MGEWAIIRERFPLSGLSLLSAATGGASEGWFVQEPCVADVTAAFGAKEAEQPARLAEACVVDADGNKVFGAKGKRYLDLPTRAAAELTRFTMDQVAPPSGKEEEDDPEGGKP